jgi:hypothetical protein
MSRPSAGLSQDLGRPRCQAHDLDLNWSQAVTDRTPAAVLTVPAGTVPVARAARTAVDQVAAASTRSALVVGRPSGPGWVSLASLGTPEGYARALERSTAYYGDVDTPVARAAAASLLTGDVASAVAVPLATALVAHRRALVLDPDDVLVRFGTLGIESVAAPWPRVVVLPSDPLAAAPDAEVADGLPAVRAAVASGYAALVGPLVAVTAGAARRGPGAMRGELAERLSAAVALAARSAGDPAAAPGEARALLAAAPRWLRWPTEWVDVPVFGPDGAAAAEPWKRRRVCCLAYQTPRFAGELCATCPRVSREETVARLSEWLSEES